MNDTLCRDRLSADDADFETLSYSNYSYSREPYYFKVLDSSDYVKVFAYIVIIMGGLLGNISVILTVVLNRSMRTTINYYVANLAVADAMICIFCMGPHILGTLTSPIFALGAFMCKFNPFMQMTCLTCSVLTLSAISCDRFMAIMFPLHVRITKQRTSIVMMVVWIISTAVSIPFLIVKKHFVIEWHDFLEPRCGEKWPVDWYYDEDEDECVSFEPLRSTYYLVVSVTLFFLPVVIMITAYSLILWKLWISEVPGERHVANINVQYRARKKVIKMVLVVLVAFIICWTPIQVMILHSAYGYMKSSLSLPYWFQDFQWFCYYIAYANSFMNPIIYGGFNKSFRDGYCIMLRCGFPSRRFNRPRRSRLTFTTGVTSSPPRYSSKAVNGEAKDLPQKSNKLEMKPVYGVNDGESSPNIKETCVIISDGTELMSIT